MQRGNVPLCAALHKKGLPVRPSGRLTIAQQFTAGMGAKKVQSVKRTAEDPARYRFFSVVRFMDFVAKFPIPAMNAPAILSRPLARTGNKTLLCGKPVSLGVRRVAPLLPLLRRFARNCSVSMRTVQFYSFAQEIRT
jgi:hypothetical protein